MAVRVPFTFFFFLLQQRRFISTQIPDMLASFSLLVLPSLGVKASGCSSHQHFLSLLRLSSLNPPRLECHAISEFNTTPPYSKSSPSSPFTDPFLSAFLKYNIVHLFLPLFLLFLASSVHGSHFCQSRNNLPLLKLLISSLAMIVKQHLVSVLSWLKRNTWRPCSIFFKHGYHLAFKQKILLFLLLLN